VTAAREKRRKFALRKIKKAQARAHGSGAGKFMRPRREARIRLANLITPARLVVW